VPFVYFKQMAVPIHHPDKNIFTQEFLLSLSVSKYIAAKTFRSGLTF
jgi:hypothetical protein